MEVGQIFLVQRPEFDREFIPRIVFHLGYSLHQWCYETELALEFPLVLQGRYSFMVRLSQSGYPAL